jgi:Holliday junction resolvase
VREKDITNKILARLRERGAFAEKIHGGPLQGRGLPDIVACYRGRFIGIEVKRPGEKPTPLQSHVLGEILKAGGAAFVLTSADEVDKCLE